MTAADLELEHSVELEVMMNGKKTTLISAVEQVVNTTALLTPIQMNGKVVGFPPNCMVNLLYVGENQVFCWKNVKLKAVRYEKKIYHCAELAGEAEIMNRRGSYRVYIGEQMELTAFSAQGPKNYPIHLKDISESGMAFFSKEEFDVGRTVRLHLTIKKGMTLQLSSQIIRVQEFENRQDRLYGCKFIEKNNRLVGFLMHLQQEKQKEKMGMKK
jgi:hypothetical protein